MPQGYLYSVLPVSAALIAIDTLASIAAIVRRRTPAGAAP